MAVSQKVSAATFAAYLTTIIITEANRRGYTIDGNEGSALTGLIALGAAFFMPGEFANGTVAASPPPAAAALHPAAVAPPT